MDHGDEVELKITGIASGGEGVGRLPGGFVLFVPGAAPGDLVEARVVQVKKSYGRAELLNVLEPSPDRVEPRCPRFGACGGCALQHVSYPAQLALKQRQVADAFRRVGGMPPGSFPISATVPSPEPWFYRNKAQFPVAAVSGRLAAGLYRPGSHELVETGDCLIQHPGNNAIIRAAAEACRRRGVRPYDERTRSGFLRHILARTSSSTGESLAVLVTFGGGPPESRAALECVAGDLMSRVEGLAGVVQNVNPSGTNVILGRENRVLAGRGSIVEVVCGVEIEVSAGSFFQVNAGAARRLYEVAIEAARLDDGDAVLDVYSGTGVIALIAARRARRVVGVEEDPRAVADAERNARRNGAANVEFIRGPAEEVLPALGGAGSHGVAHHGASLAPSVVFLDPPRKGCDPPVLEAVSSMRPRGIVYISCNPATLARDAAALCAGGYRVLVVTPVDMFPHTAHVEAVALLGR